MKRVPHNTFSIRMNAKTKRKMEKLRDASSQPIGVLIEAALQHTFGVAPHRKGCLEVLEKLNLVRQYKEKN